MRSVARAFAVALGGLVLAGCGLFGGGEAKKPMVLTDFNATANPKLAWSASVGKAGGFRFSPRVVGNRVYAAAADGAITILEEESGKVVQRFDTKRALSSGAGGDENLVIVGTSKAEAAAFDTSGQEKWVARLGGEVLAPAVSVGASAIVRTAEGQIYSLALASGKPQWVYQRTPPALLLRAATSVLTTPTNVVAGFPGGKLIALDLDTGKLTWEVTVSVPRGATELERVADVSGLPVIDGGRICAAAFQGKVACFEIQNGTTLWTRDLSTAHSLALDDKSLYLVDDEGNVHALDRGSGVSRWKQDKMQRRGLTAPVLLDGKIVVGDAQGYLHVLSADDGALVGRLRVDGGAVNAIVAASFGLLVQTAGGTLSFVRN